MPDTAWSRTTVAASGTPPSPGTGYDYDTFAADLDALLKHLDLNEVALVGFSMGGGEVARYIGSYGTERVAKAVLAAAVPPYLYKSDDNPEGGSTTRPSPASRPGSQATASPSSTTSPPASSVPTTISRRASPSASTPRKSPRSPPPRARSTASRPSGRTDFRGDVAKISVPTLVIHGDSDAIVPYEVSGKRSAELIEGARLVVIKDAPHRFNASHAEEFNQALLSFLAG